MGVHGLWKLIESAGKPVPVETLENKVLAVDVSIWLHQLMKGYQTPAGASVSNAYLLGLFTRVCKLLFTNVKPVFVFDGGVPQLKKKTIAARQNQKNKSAQASEKLREQLLKNLLKQKAVGQVLEEIRGQSSPKKKAPDMYELPPLPEVEESDVEEMSASSSEEDVKPIKLKFRDLHTIDVNSDDFKTLPADMRHDILTELKETRKQNSWGRIHEMPEESGDFSKYQMSRLLKRRSVQVSLEEAEKEMGGRTLSLHDVEQLFAEGGIEINPQLSKRIASDDVTRFIYVTGTEEQSKSSQAKLREKESSTSKISSTSQVIIKEEIISSDELSDSELIKEVEAIEMVHNQLKIKEEKLDDLTGVHEGEESGPISVSVPSIKIKEEVIDSDGMPDTEIIREAKTVGPDGVEESYIENEEFGTENMFESESSSEGIIIDSMDLVKDNSGLSQEQILTLIKQENSNRIKGAGPQNKNLPSTSRENTSLDENSEESMSGEVDEMDKDIKTSCESKILDSLYFKWMNKMISTSSCKTKRKKFKSLAINTQSNESKNVIPKQQTKKREVNLSINTKKNVSKNIMPKPEQKKTEEVRLSPINFYAFASTCSSDSETENTQNLPCQVSEIVSPNYQDHSSISSSNKTDVIDKTQPTMNTNNQQYSSPEPSSSDSDSDFIEVSPSKEGMLLSTTPKKSELHIHIQTNQSNIEDDIFADIFEDEKNPSSTTTVDKVNISSLNDTQISNKISAEKNKINEITNKIKNTITAQEHFKENILSQTQKNNTVMDCNEENVSISINNINTTEINKNIEEISIDTNKTSKTEISIEINTAKDNEVSLSENITEVSINKEEPSKSITDIEVNSSKNNKHISSTNEVEPESEGSENTDEPDLIVDTSAGVINTTEEHKPKRTLNEKQLEKLQDILETKERELLVDHNREDRMATSITDQMYQEAQELLRLFGVPYVVAPMEAEAQCAFMDIVGLTQGTITDDSDIWLFGGNKVYKNFFDQKKFVLEFQASDIQHYFKLSRGHMVLLALLVGSDYTVGLQGVGPVTAMEILATFPPPPTHTQSDPSDAQKLLTSLEHFKVWWQSRTQAYAPLAKKLKNVELHQGFPSPAVVSAYLQPIVDDSQEPFSWGAPDLSGLRDYAERKFGWSRNRTDQILLPVVNRLSQKTSQLTLHTFFGAVPNIPAHREQMSKRVQSAVNRLEGGSEGFVPVEPRPLQPRSRGRGRAARPDTDVPVRGGGRGRGRGRGALDDEDRLFIHESVGKAQEIIPQREKDRQEALKRKQQAIDIIKNKKRKGMKKRKNVRQEKIEANLSESSSDDN